MRTVGVPEMIHHHWFHHHHLILGDSTALIGLLWKHNESALNIDDTVFSLLIHFCMEYTDHEKQCMSVHKSSYSATYCQSNWCHPQSLVEV